MGAPEDAVEGKNIDGKREFDPLLGINSRGDYLVRHMGLGRMH
jgi:hypothetical protein